MISDALKAAAAILLLFGLCLALLVALAIRFVRIG